MSYYFAPPIDSLPPILRNVVYALIDAHGISPRLSAVTAIGMLSAAQHGFCNVLTENGPSPTSLNLHVVAQSGAGKNTAFRLLGNGIKKAEHDRLKHLPESPDLTGENAQTLHIEATPEAILDNFRHCPVQDVVAPDAESFLKSQTRGPSTIFNDIWSGDGAHQARISRANINVPDARLGMLLASQVEPYLNFRHANRNQAIVNGYESRLLLVYADEGYRPNMMTTMNASQKEAIANFTAHTYAARQRSISGAPRIALKLSTAAMCRLSMLSEFVRWTHDQKCWTETEIPWANRLVEKVMRLAPHFELAAGHSHEISATAMEMACTWGEWFAQEHQRLLGPMGLLTLEVRDAQSVWKAMPTKARLKKALLVLEREQKLQVLTNRRAKFYRPAAALIDRHLGMYQPLYVNRYQQYQLPGPNH
jgi:hypothetical protein